MTVVVCTMTSTENNISRVLEGNIMNIEAFFRTFLLSVVWKFSCNAENGGV